MKKWYLFLSLSFCKNFPSQSYLQDLESCFTKKTFHLTSLTKPCVFTFKGELAFRLIPLP